MREIKFRGKRIDNGEWIYGWLFKDSLTGKICIQQTTSKILKDRGHKVISHTTREVNPESVGQFTGLTSEKGEDLYEGDILKIPDNWDLYKFSAGEIYEIYFNYGGFRFKPKENPKAKGCWFEEDGEYEKIGNIHENPELLS